MYKTITSTELKQNTRRILKEVMEDPTSPMLVTTYEEPKVVIISYDEWQKTQQSAKYKPKKSKEPKTLYDKVKKYIAKDGPQIDSTKIIRKWRDAE